MFDRVLNTPVYKALQNRLKNIASSVFFCDDALWIPWNEVTGTNIKNSCYF